MKAYQNEHYGSNNLLKYKVHHLHAVVIQTFDWNVTKHRSGNHAVVIPAAAADCAK